MPEVNYIRQAGKSILLLDISGIKDFSKLGGLVDEAIRLARMPNEWRSVLSLIDLTGTRLNGTVGASLKRLSRSNGPYVKAIAFVGFSPVWSFLMKLFLKVARKRNHRVMRDRGEAMLWLLQQ